MILQCGRCKRVVFPGEDETCWYCLDILCFDCWDRYGHCGHPEADKANEAARKVKQPNADISPIN